jgi:hypothetical protein
LRLENNNIGDVGASSIGASLSYVKSIFTIIDFIGSIFAVCVALYHSVNKSLTSLSLQHNCIEDAGGVALALGLGYANFSGCHALSSSKPIITFYSSSANSTLITLAASHNPMSATTHKAIELEFVLCQMRNPTITSIRASWKGFNDEDAHKIYEGLWYALSLLPFV